MIHSKLIRQTGGAAGKIDFIYGASGMIGFEKDGTRYFFRRNLMGDVTHIYDETGTLFAEYVYDAWGNHQIKIDVNDIGTINPIRYRGYYYDAETGLYYLRARYYDPETGRFISQDDVSYLAPTHLSGLNLYAYCGNNPVNRIDRTGQFWDYIFDAAFLVWSVIDLIKDPSDWKNWVALGVDIVFAVIPFVPSGVGQVIKVGNKVDDAVDVAKAINKIDNIHDATKVTMIGRDMQRVKNTANYIGKADDLYDAWKGYGTTASGIKRIVHNGISVSHDASWMFGKLRCGYTVIDIGVTTVHDGFGLWYGVERIVNWLWKTRNFWKFPINYFM